MKHYLIAVSLLISSLTAFGQLGEFGSAQIELVGFGRYAGPYANLSPWPIPTTGRARYLLSEPIGSNLTYSRHYPLTLSLYLGVGVGYNYSDFSVGRNRSSGVSDYIEEVVARNSGHFLNVPIDLVYILSRRSNQHSEEVLTAYEQADWNGGLSLKLRFNTLHALRQSRTFTTQANPMHESLADQFNSLVINSTLQIGYTLERGAFYFAIGTDYLSPYIKRGDAKFTSVDGAGNSYARVLYVDPRFEKAKGRYTVGIAFEYFIR